MSFGTSDAFCEYVLFPVPPPAQQRDDDAMTIVVSIWVRPTRMFVSHGNHRLITSLLCTLAGRSSEHRSSSLSLSLVKQCVRCADYCEGCI